MLNCVVNHGFLFFFLILLSKLVSTIIGIYLQENTGCELQRKKASDNFLFSILPSNDSLPSSHILIQKLGIMEEAKRKVKLLISCDIWKNILILGYSFMFFIFPFWKAYSLPSMNPNLIYSSGLSSNPAYTRRLNCLGLWCSLYFFTSELLLL